MRAESAKKSIYSLILKDHVFCDVLNMFMHITLLNNTQVSLFLNIPVNQVEEIRSGKLFGVMNKTLCYKLDTLFDTKNGFFYEVLKETLLTK